MSDSVPFSATKSQSTGTLTFTHTDGRAISILRDSAGYDKAIALLTQINALPIDDPTEDALREDLFNLTVPASRIAKLSHGDIKIEKGQITFRDAPIHNVVGTRILWMLDHDEDPQTMVVFLDNLLQNPSYRAVNELFRFMESNQMGITKDGYLLAYKRVNDDFSSIYRDVNAAVFDNSPGKTVEMMRNAVDDNAQKTCSDGLHVCSMKYLPSYRAADKNDRIVICKIHPRDVVSVPLEEHNGKIRVCRYDVLREIMDEDGDILGTKPVWPVDSPVSSHNDSFEAADDNSVEGIVARIIELAEDNIHDVDIDSQDETFVLARRELISLIEDEYGVALGDVSNDESIRDIAQTVHQQLI